MEFLHPNFLIIIPFFLVLIIFKNFFYKKSSSIQVSSFNSLKYFFGYQGRVKVFLINAFYITALISIIIGLARPQISSVDKDITVEVIDIVLVLDTSSSMLAEDFKPNRLEAVKEAAKEFINNRNGDRIGLLVFGKETFIQCPLTIDYSVLNNLLSEVTIMEPKYDGTAVGVAIANGVNRLRNSDSENKIIILLSDGIDNSLTTIDPIDAAKIANEYNIKVYTIGAGTNQSVTQMTAAEKTLKEIAKETNAKYFRATDKQGLSDIYSEIDELEKSEITVSYFSSNQEIYIWFLIIGFSLLVISEILRAYYFRRII